MVQAGVFFCGHNARHFVRHLYAMAVLEWPHALGMEDAHPISIVQDMAQVWLEARHGTQLPVDEGNPALIILNPQAFQ